MKVLVEGGEYEMVHDFGNGRGIVDMEGVYALADWLQDGSWEFSGEPARESEKPVLNRFVSTVKNQTTVTAPDGSTKTYSNE